MSKLNETREMFSNASLFNQHISNWDVSGVYDMNSMFLNAKAFNQNIGAWNVIKATRMPNMFQGVTLSTANYNNFLIGWAAKTVKTGVAFNGGDSQYSTGAAAAARAILTGTYGWTINDGGELTTVAVSSSIADNISAYPNPTTGILNFDLAGERIQNLKVINLMGKTVLEKTTVHSTATINLSGFANGLYVVVVQIDNGSKSFRVVKE